MLGSSRLHRTRHIRTDKLDWVQALTWGRAGRYGLLIALVASIMYPAGILVYLAFWSGEPGGPGHLTLQWFHEAFGGAAFNRVVIATLVFATAKCAFAALLGGGLAFLVTRTDLPAPRTVSALAATPFFVPSMLTALAWIIIANPKTGYVNVWFRHHANASNPLVNIYTMAGMLFQATPITAALFFLLTVGAFRGLSSDLEEAAQICGASRWTMVRTVVIPMMGPALTGAAILALIRGIEAFETPFFLGNPGGIFVVSTEIYRYLRLDTPPEPGAAGALSMAIVALTCVVLALQSRVLARRSFVTASGRGMSARRLSLGAWRWPLFALVVVYFAIVLAVPLIFLVAGSFTSVFGVFSPTYLTVQNWTAVFASRDMWRAYAQTLVVAFVAGGCAVVTAGLVAYIRVRFAWWGGKVMESLTWLPWAMPGMVLALAFLWAAILLPPIVNIYGTVELLLIAFVVSSLPVGVRVMFGTISQIGAPLEEAARVCGASPARAVFDVIVPIVRVSAVAAWVVIAYGIVGNLTLPVLLSAPGTELLSFQLLQIYSSGSSSQAAVLAIVILVTMAAIMVLGVAANRLLRARSANGLGS